VRLGEEQLAALLQESLSVASRLARGRFLWPSPADGAMTISPAQLGYLLSGIDWMRPQEPRRPTSVGSPFLI